MTCCLGGIPYYISFHVPIHDTYITPIYYVVASILSSIITTIDYVVAFVGKQGMEWSRVLGFRV